MKKIIINRYTYMPEYTEGKMYVCEGAKVLFACNTLEPPSAGLTTGSTNDEILAMKKKCSPHLAIPAGEYEGLVHYPSRKFKGERICLLGVPCFRGILIHEGNAVNDTAGCILVGVRTSPGILSASKKVLAQLWAVVKGDDKIKVKINDCVCSKN